LFRNNTLADREDIGVVVLARKASDLFIPTQRATNASNLVRSHRFAISRSAKDDAAIAFPLCHRFGRRANEEWIIDWLFTRRAEICHFVTKLSEQFFYFFLVAEARVIRAERDFHATRFYSAPPQAVEPKRSGA